jgi:predicted TIM-barrel fold metal-dependent hydrolase
VPAVPRERRRPHGQHGRWHTVGHYTADAAVPHDRSRLTNGRQTLHYTGGMAAPLTYDVHTHIGADQGFYLRGWRPYAAGVPDLLAHMDEHGIDRAVCFPFTLPSAFDAVAFADHGKVELLPGRVPFDRENRLLIEEIEALGARERLYPLAMIDPSRKVAEQISNLELIAERISGLKLQSTIIQSPVRSLIEAGRELMDFAAQHRLPVLLHATVWSEMVHAQVSDCLAVADAFPGVRICLAHSLAFHAEYLKMASERPNVWVDCAAHLANCELARGGSPIIAPPGQRVDADYSKPAQVLEAVHAILGSRYLWGSDNPFMSWCDDQLRLIYSYHDEATVLHALPKAVRLSMSSVGPPAWLMGERSEEA